MQSLGRRNPGEGELWCVSTCPQAVTPHQPQPLRLRGITRRLPRLSTDSPKRSQSNLTREVLVDDGQWSWGDGHPPWAYAMPSSDPHTALEMQLLFPGGRELIPAQPDPEESHCRRRWQTAQQIPSDAEVGCGFN